MRGAKRVGVVSNAAAMTTAVTHLCVRTPKVIVMAIMIRVNRVDNSDPNAQRHFQAKDEFAAFKTLFLPIIVTSLMFLFVSAIWDCGLLQYKLHDYGNIDKEAFYLPDGCKSLVLIAIVCSFITTLESIINWGGGLLTVDIIKTYLHKDGTDRQYTALGLAAMFLVSLIALLFAFKSDKILNLQKFNFSISAGAGLSLYPLKIVNLTLLVVSTWLTVMYCTAPDDKKPLQRFVRQTGTSGIWPKDFVQSGYYALRQRLFLCFIFALTYILPFI